MATASFQLTLETDEQALDRLSVVVGQEAKGRVTIETPKTYRNAKIEWQLGWKACGEETNEEIVSSGVHSLPLIQANDPVGIFLPIQVPDEAPPSYTGHLFSVAWFLRISLKVSWVFNPKREWQITVVPRVEKGEVNNMSEEKGE